MDVFRPENIDLVAVFSSGRFEVPKFQRGYEWGAEQIENFWADLESVKNGAKETLFFGTFIFLQDKEKKGTFLIIDGQQRITTLQLLLIAVRARAKSLLDENPLLLSDVNQLVEYSRNKYSRDRNTGEPRVVVAKGVRPLFDVMAHNQWDGIIPEKILGIDGRTYRKMRKQISHVYNFFYGKVKNADAEEVAELLSALTRMFVTKIELDDYQEAFDIFERTNARGIKLAQSDLVKNLLFQNAPEILHNQIDEKWDTVTFNAADKISQLLKYFVITKNGPTLRKEIFPSLSQYVRQTSAEILIGEILTFSLFYRMMTREGTSSFEHTDATDFFKQIDFKDPLEDDSRKRMLIRSITSFQLFSITQVYPVIYSYILALKHNRAEIESSSKRSSAEMLLSFIKRLENFHFVNTVIGKNIGNQVENVYAETAKKFAVSSTLGNVHKTEADFKKKLLDLREKRKAFISQFSELSCEDQSREIFYYLFDRISNAESKGGQIHDLYKHDRDIKQKSFNLEHFYPVSLFMRENDPIGPEYGNNIGNLLVISRHSNSSFNNASPEQKFELIQSDEKYLANVGNAKRVILKYKRDDWNRELIETRGTELAQYAYDVVWNIDI